MKADVHSAVAYILQHEGGLSNNTADSASAHPAPWEYGGKTGWHTNKGITYTTFSTLAGELGYENNANNFFSMPFDIWLKIYQFGYWTPMGCDNLNSQAMADGIADFAWASGVGGSTKQIRKWLLTDYAIIVSSVPDTITAINTLTAKDEKGTFEKFIEWRKNFFIALKNPTYEKGWLARMDALASHGFSVVGKLISDNKGIAGALLFFLGLQ